MYTFRKQPNNRIGFLFWICTTSCGNMAHCKCIKRFSKKFTYKIKFQKKGNKLWKIINFTRWLDKIWHQLTNSDLCLSYALPKLEFETIHLVLYFSSFMSVSEVNNMQEVCLFYNRLHVFFWRLSNKYAMQRLWQSTIYKGIVTF